MNFVVQQGPKKPRAAPGSADGRRTRSSAGKAGVEFDGRHARLHRIRPPPSLPPGTPVEHIKTLREAFVKMLADPGFTADAKKLVDWDGSSMGGEQLQKRIERAVTQPPEIIKRVKEILQ